MTRINKTKNIRKKLKATREKQYIDKDTGEVVSLTLSEQIEKDVNFHKMWLPRMVKVLNGLGSKKIEVINFIISNINKENQLTMPQRKISKLSKVSYPVVSKTMLILQKSNFLTKTNYGGAYRINPEILFKGGTASRMNITNKYQQEKSENVKKHLS